METGTADVGGLLLVDKPAGMTSHDVVAIVRRASRVKRVGHTGTLDPFATGLLIVLVGRGTRLIPFVDGEPKVYDATVRFGAETNSDDITGSIVREAPLPSNVAVAEAIARLTGPIEQVPPSYSAKKVDGVRAYAAARRGAALALAPARVIVHEWTLMGGNERELHVRIVCSGGTYIRALARDLGRYAGSAAHLVALRRVRSGPFDVASATTIDTVQSGALPFRPLRSGIPSLPAQRLNAVDMKLALHGNSVAARVSGERVALLDDEETLIAVANRVGDALHPVLVLRDG